MFLRLLNGHVIQSSITDVIRLTESYLAEVELPHSR